MMVFSLWCYAPDCLTELHIQPEEEWYQSSNSSFSISERVRHIELIHQWLHLNTVSTSQICKVSKKLSPDEIQKSISSLNRFNVSTVGHRTVSAAFAWADYHHNDDADEHSDESGDHIVDHCTHTHFTGGFAVQRGNTWDRGHLISSHCKFRFCYHQV